MNQVEAEGKTLEEALLRASRMLGVDLNSVGYEVLETKGRLLGILGRKVVKVRAWIQQEGSREALVFLEKLLSIARLECRVAQVREEDEVLGLDLEGEDSGLLLRKDGGAPGSSWIPD